MTNEKQTIKGDVGNVISGNVTINNFSSDISDDQQPITVLQKQELHRLLDKLVLLGENKRELWRMLHTRLDTSTINELTTIKFHRAVEIIKEMEIYIKEKKDCNTLISKIIKITVPSLNRQRDEYCLKQFGTTHMKRLNKEQLQRLFCYFNELVSAENHYYPFRKKYAIGLLFKWIVQCVRLK